MGKTHYHLCQDIEGALANWTMADWNRVAKENDMGRGYGGNFPGEYCKWEFQNMLKDGLKVLPMGKCEGFSNQTGCPGHPVEESSDDRQGSKKDE